MDARQRERQSRQGGKISMLVLTRKSNQSIMIGDDIEVSVLAIMGEKVRIGIQAPREVPVFRKEVYLEIQQEEAAGREGSSAEVDAALRDMSETQAQSPVEKPGS
jgi:carbon storage regulator